MGNVNQNDARKCAQGCAAANVRRASRAITRFYAEFLAEVGLEPTQYTLLVACTLVDRPTVGQLADSFAMDRSGLARNIAVLETRGLLKVSPGKDRRTRRVELTPLGHRTFAEAYPLWRAAQSEIEKQFGRERLEHLISELRALTLATSPPK
jgi:DNA-binding MarR family transcriptional regulator